MRLIAIPHPNLPCLTYGMLFVVADGLYPTICGVISWNGKCISLLTPIHTRLIEKANNLAGSWKRSIGMGLQISLGNLGGTIGSNIFLAKQKLHYWLGYGFSLGIICKANVSPLVLKFFL
jgi:hypothetical protein